MMRSLRQAFKLKKYKIDASQVTQLTQQEQAARQQQEDAAILLQKHIRGFVARKKYGISQLRHTEMENYPTFVIGNDPEMPTSLADFHENDEKVALVATSGVRALAIACQLGNRQHTPKIFLIDNSQQVCEFWLALRAFAADETRAATAEMFLANLPEFLHRHENLYQNLPDLALQRKGVVADGVQYPNQNISQFFVGLIRKYDYEYMRAILVHASILKQTWADAEVFVKVKNILTHQGIRKVFMYPSNIATYTLDAGGSMQTVEKILENIEKTAPVMAIHTDGCPLHGVPEKVYLVENHEASQVRDRLFTASQCGARNHHGFGGVTRVVDMCDLNDFVMLLQMMQASRSNNNSNSMSHW